MGIGHLVTHPIKWQRSVPFGRAFFPVPSDQPLARRRYFAGKGVQIVLPYQMRGGLRPEEWRPLIASLFAYSKVRKRDFISPLVVALLLLGASGGILVQLFFSTQIPQGIQFIWSIGLILLVILVPRVIRRTGRGREDWLRADRMAADIAGRTYS